MDDILLVIESLGQMALILNNIITVIAEMIDDLDDENRCVALNKLSMIQKNIFKVTL